MSWIRQSGQVRLRVLLAIALVLLAAVVYRALADTTPTIVGAANGCLGNGSSSATCTVVTPTGCASGDVLLAHLTAMVTSGKNIGSWTATGFTAVDSYTGVTPATSLWRLNLASAPAANYTFSANRSSGGSGYTVVMTAVLSCWRSVDTSAPDNGIDAHSIHTAPQTPAIASGVTLGHSGSQIIVGYSGAGGRTFQQPFGASTPTPSPIVAFAGNPTPTPAITPLSLYIFANPQPTATTIGNLTSTESGGGWNAGMLVALKPATSTPSPSPSPTPTETPTATATPFVIHYINVKYYSVAITPTDANHILIAHLVGKGVGANSLSVSDDRGNLWLRADATCANGTALDQEVWYTAGPISTSATTVSATGASPVGGRVWEFENVGGFGIAGACGTGSGTTITSGQITVPNATDLAVTMLSSDAAGGGTFGGMTCVSCTTTPATFTTFLTQNASPVTSSAYRVVTAAGNMTSQESYTSSGNWVGNIVTFTLGTPPIPTPTPTPTPSPTVAPTVNVAATILMTPLGASGSRAVTAPRGTPLALKTPSISGSRNASAIVRSTPIALPTVLSVSVSRAVELAPKPPGLAWTGNNTLGTATSWTLYPSLSSYSTVTGLTGVLFMRGDRQGRLYVASVSGNSIKVFAPYPSGAATPIRTISGANTTLNGPRGMAFDADGNLWVANYGAQTVLEFSPSANGNVAPIATIAPAGYYPIDVDFDSSNGMFVPAYNNAVVMYWAAGNRTNSPTREFHNSTYFGGPDAVRVAPDDTVWVSGFSTSYLSRWANNASGLSTPLQAFTSADRTSPRGIQVDANGYIYVTFGSSTTSNLEVFAPGTNGTSQSALSSVSTGDLVSGLTIYAPNNALPVLNPAALSGSAEVMTPTPTPTLTPTPTQTPTPSSTTDRSGTLALATVLGLSAARQPSPIPRGATVVGPRAVPTGVRSVTLGRSTPIALPTVLGVSALRSPVVVRATSIALPTVLGISALRSPSVSRGTPLALKTPGISGSRIPSPVVRSTTLAVASVAVTGVRSPSVSRATPLALKSMVITSVRSPSVVRATPLALGSVVVSGNRVPSPIGRATPLALVSVIVSGSRTTYTPVPTQTPSPTPLVTVNVSGTVALQQLLASAVRTVTVPRSTPIALGSIQSGGGRAVSAVLRSATVALVYELVSTVRSLGAVIRSAAVGLPGQTVQGLVTVITPIPTMTPTPGPTPSGRHLVQVNVS